MSEYLGWKDSPSKVKPPKFDRDIIPGGPVTKSYETYVKNIFHPGNRLKGVDKDQRLLDHGVSATNMLRMERSLGRNYWHAILARYGNLPRNCVVEQFVFAYDDDCLLKTPLEALYNELGLKGPEQNLYRNYPVYKPKQSSEYYSVMNSGRARDHWNMEDEPSMPSYREKDDQEWSKNNRQTLVDYKDFHSSPLSPFLYQKHPYIRSQDTRIIGSNFVQITSRPKDRFLEKVEKTLEEVRNSSRYA